MSNYVLFALADLGRMYDKVKEQYGEGIAVEQLGDIEAELPHLKGEMQKKGLPALIVGDPMMTSALLECVPELQLVPRVIVGHLKAEEYKSMGGRPAELVKEAETAGTYYFQEFPSEGFEDLDEFILSKVAAIMEGPGNVPAMTIRSPSPEGREPTGQNRAR